MTEFKKENRYLVLKLSELEPWQIEALMNTVYYNDCEHAQRKGVFVEEHWPEHEVVWKMIEDRIKDRC